ncbi:aminotransferase class III-fold pyridoxal phosphate-dependent enzyme [Streptosporangium sp. NPDC051022]|uniref:aminotransferase class III-fold pyridoxal phosphate-dependent enzyme n=1 Tax=Streptosporangium sp. NPDC051022 TaxID=3155752 RepID=UPI003419FB28
MTAIAVVAMACRFPGGVTSPEDLWRLLVEEVDAIGEVPPERWPVDRLYSADPAEPGKISSRWAGCVDGIEEFDAAFFGLSPAEAEQMDPQQRMLLEVAYEAMERAGLPPSHDLVRDCGVFVGISGSDYGRALGGDLSAIGPYFSTGQALSIAANRISYAWDMRGPSVAVDTACSSGLVAVDMAVQSLRRGACSVALAGAVNVVLGPENWVSLSRFGMMATDGRCRSFGAGGDGFVRSDGCALLLLKPLEAAERDGDEILAVIRGSAVNQDGRSNGLTAPNGPAQETVIRRALADAGLRADAVSYVEAHGSGTQLGDPIEMGALLRTYGRRETGICHVGSVKSNIGHTEAAAGIAGLAKLILCLRHGHLPASLHSTPPNPRLRLDGTKMRVVTEALPWAAAEPLTGAVSSFGFGGTNAHVIVSAGPPGRTRSSAPVPTPVPVPTSVPASTSGSVPTPVLVSTSGSVPVSVPGPGPAPGSVPAPGPASVPPPGPVSVHGALVLPLSARSETALRVLAGRYADFLRAREEVSLTDLCHSAAVRRAHHRHRAAVVVRDREQLLRELEDLPVTADDGAPWRDPVLVFSGQGAWRPGTARHLLDEVPFAEVVARCEPVFRRSLNVSVRALLGGEEPLPPHTDVAQAVLFTFQAGMYDLWRSLGVVPAAVVGHSAGETAAAYAAGLLDLESAARLTAARGASMRRVHGCGRMVAVTGPAAEAVPYLEDGVVIAAHNGPGSFVVSGPDPALTGVTEALGRAGFGCVPLPGEYAFHSPHMRPAAEAMRAARVDPAAPAGSALFCSTVLGEIVGGTRLDSGYWAEGITGPVRFQQAIETLLETGFSAFLEIGPKPIHASGIAGTARRRGDAVRVVQAHRDGGTVPTLVRLYRAGAELNWDAVCPTGVFVPDLPTYPWQRTRHWAITKDSGMRDDIVTTIRTLLADHLKLSPAEVSDHAKFLDLGADSLVLLKLVSQLNERYGSSFQPTMLFDDYPTVRALAVAIEAQAPAPAPAPAAVAVAVAAPQVTVVPAAAVPGTTAVPAVAVSGTTAVPPGAGAGPVTADESITRILAAQLAVMQEQLRVLGTGGNGSGGNGSGTGGGGSGSNGNGGGASAARSQPAVPSAPAAASPAAQPATPPAAPPATPPAAPSAGRSRADRLSPPQQRYVDELVARMSARDDSAKKLAGTYRPRLAESRPWANFRPELKELLVPVVAERARGARIWDAAGNAYTDYCMGFGVQLFGHNPDFVTEAVRRQLDQTYSLGYQLRQSYELAEQFCRVTGHDRVTFCNTGSEAVMGAVRLARLATGRRRIAYFEKSYHGLVDAVLARGGLEPGQSLPIAPGLSPGAVDEAIVLPYGEDASLEHLRAVADDLAAVIIEPVQNRNPSVQPAAFLAALRRLTAERGIVLIADEMITGFRAGPRGAMGHFGVTPDLATYGKILGGGLPIAAIAGRSDLMDGMDGGSWGYGDDSAPTARTTLFGGTFQKHPLSVSAARAVLDHIEARGPALYEELNGRAKRVTDALAEIIRTEELPYTIASFGSLWRVEYRGASSFYQPLQLEMLYQSLLADGVYVWEGRTFFLSTAHDDRDVDQLLEAVERGVDRLREAEFLPPRKDLQWPATPQQRRLWRLQRDHGPEWTAYHESVLLHLRGPLDEEAAVSAVRSVWRRHTALRATVAEEGTLLRCDRNVTLDVPVVEGDDFRRWTNAPFPLEGGPLFRAALLRHGPDLHTLVLCAHHLVMDGVSAALILADLTDAYAQAVHGGSPPTAVVPVPERLRGLAHEGRGGTAPPPEPVAAVDFEPASRHTSRLPSGFWSAVTDRAKRVGCTPFMLAFSAFGHALHQVTGRAELSVGVHVDRRATPDEHAFVGHFLEVATVTSSSSESFDDYHGRIQGRLTRLLGATDRLDSAVEVVFDLNPALTELSWPGLEVEIAAPEAGHAKYGLFFDVIPIGEEGLVEVTYRAPFDHDLVERLHDRWMSLLS